MHYLSDRAKLREFKNDKLLLCLYYLMIKFESYLAVNNKDNKINTATPMDDTPLIWQRVTKMASCCIVCNLTTETRVTFWVGGWSN